MNSIINKPLAALISFMFLLLSGAAFAYQMSNGHTQKPTMIMLQGKDIKWLDGPKSLPPGSKYAILAGDPSKPGAFTMRLKFPANYSLPAHHHLLTENVTVISGNVYFGAGDKLNKSKSTLFTPGSFISMPPKTNHFAWTGDNEVELQLNNNGPWEIIYADPKTDPRNQ